MITATIGVRLLMNATNVSSFTALPIMIFGGSPIKVAVPPTLDAIICVMRNGTGGTLSCLVMLNVTGTMRSTVVTLSRNAEPTAVMSASTIMMRTGLPFAFLAAQMAMYLNSPVSAVIETIIIMPINKPSVLKSM